MKTHRLSFRERIIHAAFMVLSVLSLALLATAANASCFDRGRGVNSPLTKHLMAQLSASPNSAHGTIVGLWQVSYTTSDNEPFQDSFDLWHSDGTELETANVDPILGNSCIGVWKQAGSEIHLHHVGWSFDNLGNLVGPFTLDDVLALSNHGNSYSGSFDFKQYDISGENLLQEVTGTISATRIEVN